MRGRNGRALWLAALCSASFIGGDLLGRMSPAASVPPPYATAGHTLTHSSGSAASGDNRLVEAQVAAILEARARAAAMPAPTPGVDAHLLRVSDAEFAERREMQYRLLAEQRRTDPGLERQEDGVDANALRGLHERGMMIY